MTEHRKDEPRRLRDLDVSASEADDVRGGRPMDDELEFVGDSEQPNPSGPGSAGAGGLVVTAAGIALDPEAFLNQQKAKAKLTTIGDPSK